MQTVKFKTVEGFGCVFIRHGSRHDWYRNAATGASPPMPRHREIVVGACPHGRQQVRRR